MSSTVSEEALNRLKAFKSELSENLESLKTQASTDLAIDDFDLDGEVLKTPKIHAKYLNLYADEMVKLKSMYGTKDKIKLERWKYWMGKQTDEYYAKNGLQHETILKQDIDKYLSADEKLSIFDEAISVQKAIVDFIERALKEIGTRNFHVRAAIDWRKFEAGS